MSPDILIRLFKSTAQLAISAKKQGSLPIIAGPLKGKRLPAAVARENMGMLVGRYEPNVIDKILSLSGSIQTAYDVGANIGYMTLALCAGANAGSVYAFEPAPSNISTIREMASENHLTDRLMIIAKALSDKNEIQLLHTWHSSAMFFLESARDNQQVNPANAFNVETCTMDSFVFDGSNKSPDFIKIDVEGAEDLVIKGALRTLRTFHPRILIEIHGPKNAQKTWDVLASLQYQWWHIDTDGKEKRVGHDDLMELFSNDSWTVHLFLTR